MNLFLKAGLVLALTFSVAACGDDDDDTIPGTPDGGGVVVADAAPTPDTGPELCSVAASYPGAEIPAEITAARKTSDTGDSIILSVAFNADQDGFSLQLYKGFGVFADGITTGTFPLTGAELNYATCGACVRFFGNSTSADPGQDFMATAGTVTITEIGATDSGNLKATLSGLTFEHVTISTDGSFTSTPVNDGCESAIDGDIVIDSPIVTDTTKRASGFAAGHVVKTSLK